ncbi:hypothetical protein J3E64_002767 [Sphingobium sp. OAS761]|nr:hypothetical protein [Sphingobium sp. OAS761]
MFRLAQWPDFLIVARPSTDISDTLKRMTAYRHYTVIAAPFLELPSGDGVNFGGVTERKCLATL